MVRTFATPKNQNLQIAIPADYVGKEVEVLVFTKEESQLVDTAEKNVMAQFWGVISQDTALKMHQHVENIRSEWERDI